MERRISAGMSRPKQVDHLQSQKKRKLTISTNISEISAKWKAPMESLGTSFLTSKIESGHFVFFGLRL